MSDPLNLHILPVLRQESKELSRPPGLYVTGSGVAKRVPHSRKADTLILHLVLTGTATIPADGQTQLLEELARAYFSAPGAVTTALRDAITELNQFLLDRNLTSASSGLQATGLLTAIVLHERQLFIAQSGPNRVYAVSQSEARHFYDPDLSGRGLGVSRIPQVQFNHARLALGDLLVLTPDTIPAWTPESLLDAHGRSMNTIHRVMMNAAGENVNAVFIQAHPGKPGFKILEREKLATEPPVRISVRDQTAPTSATGKTPPGSTAAIPASGEEAPAAEPPPPAQAPRRKKEKRPIGPMLLAVLRAFGTAMRSIGHSLKAILIRILPGTELGTIPGSTMAFFAVAIPIVIVAVAGFVYVRRGQDRQYTQYMQQAQEAIDWANGQTDPANIRLAWETVLVYMDAAEEYHVTDETIAIRQLAYIALDPLEVIDRLNFQPALNGPLSENVNIIRMAATRDELYMLDSFSGSIIRAWLSGRGYEIDRGFNCGPGSYGSYLVGDLIDMAALPRNNSQGASIMAMDANGIVVYCRPEKPLLTVPLFPPNSNWGDPKAFVLDSGALYVLDPQTNAVWIYSGEDYSFVDPPRLFFDDDVPVMADVIDFAIDLDDLYLLHEDGHLTTCTFGFAGQPTTCTSPTPYTDTRGGRVSGATMEETHFTQIAFTTPPDPSIFLLDPEQAAIFHFSLRLTFQRQLREVAPLGEPATAFAISPSRSVFIGMGNEILWANLP